MSPDFAVVKPYVLNHLKANYWKIQDIMSFDDAVGEAQLQFWRTVHRLDRRGCAIANDRHLLSLFRTSWTRHFVTLANKNTKTVHCVELSDDRREWLEQSAVADWDNDGYISVLLAQAPAEIKQVLLLLMHMPAELMDVVAGLMERGLMDAANSVVSRLVGKPDRDAVLVKAIRYLRPES